MRMAQLKRSHHYIAILQVIKISSSLLEGQALANTVRLMGEIIVIIITITFIGFLFSYVHTTFT